MRSPAPGESEKILTIPEAMTAALVAIAEISDLLEAARERGLWLERVILETT